MSEEQQEDLRDDVAGLAFGEAFVVPEVMAEAEVPLPEFDPRWREDLSGLLFLGNLTSTFTWPGATGHRFAIRTITTDDYLRVALKAKAYEATMGDMRSYQTAIVAACIVGVDGRSVGVPALEGEDVFDVKWRWATRQFSWTIDAVYNQFCILENVVALVMENLGKASGAPTAATPGSSPVSASPETAAYLQVVDHSIAPRS